MKSLYKKRMKRGKAYMKKLHSRARDRHDRWTLLAQYEANPWKYMGVPSGMGYTIAQLVSIYGKENDF